MFITVNRFRGLISKMGPPSANDRTAFSTYLAAFAQVRLVS